MLRWVAEKMCTSGGRHAYHSKMPFITIWRSLWGIPHSCKIWQSGFFWPTMYEDTKDFIQRCGSCQRHGNIIARDVMPLTINLQIELFDVWGIDYMGPFVKSWDYEYILVAIDYVSKWGRSHAIQEG